MSEEFVEAISPIATNASIVAPKPQGLRILIILSALMGFASISTDLYLPAMPAMAGDLNADAGSIELTVSGFLIGFSLGQLLWGPLGDRYGRRLPVAAGLLLFILGSVGCATSGTSAEMICWRIVQAVGACSGVVLSRDGEGFVRGKPGRADAVDAHHRDGCRAASGTDRWRASARRSGLARDLLALGRRWTCSPRRAFHDP